MTRALQLTFLECPNKRPERPYLAALKTQAYAHAGCGSIDASIVIQLPSGRAAIRLMHSGDGGGGGGGDDGRREFKQQLKREHGENGVGLCQAVTHAGCDKQN